ncbi:DUF1992 domain-containing protein [Streptomyces sp. NPDC058665]|uniref:DnaJ family domain-containing protein n=1 Tax=Streptomyces sp. NPDC058665 TaxID=3346586 RepID=UPI0036603739
MTERKPPGITFETWVDRQIREAAERGAFDDLPGAGKPLASADAPYDELWWIKGKMEREGISYAPPTLMLRKEVEDAVVAASEAASEAQARRIITDINERIRAALARPHAGPPLNKKPYDIEEIAAEWRERH